MSSAPLNMACLLTIAPEVRDVVIGLVPLAERPAPVASIDQGTAALSLPARPQELPIAALRAGARRVRGHAFRVERSLARRANRQLHADASRRHAPRPTSMRPRPAARR